MGGTVPNTTLSPSERFCVKMGRSVRHFDVSFIVRGKVTRPCPKTTAFES